MKSAMTSRGVLGRAEPLPDQGAVFENAQAFETKRQSCPTEQTTRSKQIRIRLSPLHANRWLALPPRLREHIASLVFGSFTEQVDLNRLVEVASELRRTRISIINAQQLALLFNGSLNTNHINAALEKIAALLGDKLP
jgi:hypothetical protein